MKKQFFRVKQLADQTFSRAGKTELLSDDLAVADRRVEFLRHACTNTHKKLAACLLGFGLDDSAREKRLKKCPEYLLGHAMLESTSCEENYVLRDVLARCGGVSVALAQELVDVDVKIEQSVVTPLQALLDNELPSIIRQKKHLQKLNTDLEAARSRYQAAKKQNLSSSSGNVHQTQTKMDTAREEMEDAASKVEQFRDTLATEMFQLISRETEIAKVIALYVNLQKTYHEKALKYLEEVIPDLETFILDSDMKPVFGLSLQEHLRVTGRRIALPLELCVCALLETHGLEEEGLFRVAGSVSKVRRVRSSLDACCLDLASAVECMDPSVLAGVLKSYLRELPEPLLTHSLYQDWLAAARIQNPPETRLQAMAEVVARLPEAHRENLQYLIKFLSALAKNQDVNKMSAQNLAIVIAPNLIWGPDHDQAALGLNMSTANIHSFIVDNLISHADFFFPEEVKFFQTMKPSEPAEPAAGSAVTPGKSTAMTASLNGLPERRGHTRSSSNDTANITHPADFSRTQSNSSLDHNSPPHSPKPVTRRKNKVAPHPPKLADGIPEKPPRPLSQPAHVMAAMMAGSQSAPPSQPLSKPPSHAGLGSAPQQGRAPVRPPEPLPPLQPLKERSEPVENLFTASEEKNGEQEEDNTEPLPPVTRPPPPAIKTPPPAVKLPPPVKTPPPTTLPPPLVPAPAVTTAPPVSSAPPSTVLPPVVSQHHVGTAPEPQKGGPRFPVAAPRTLASREFTQQEPHSDGTEERAKPAIPSRPACLQRQSGSFRNSRDASTATAGAEIPPEPHTPEPQLRTEKPPAAAELSQQEGCSQDKMSLQEKRHSGEKPERPPKPDLNLLASSVAQTPSAGERNSMPGNDSTDDELDQDTKSGGRGASTSPRGSHPTRPPRPTPPPPPPPTGRAKVLGAPASESTDL